MRLPLISSKSSWWSQALWKYVRGSLIWIIFRFVDLKIKHVKPPARSHSMNPYCYKITRVHHDDQPFLSILKNYSLVFTTFESVFTFYYCRNMSNESILSMYLVLANYDYSSLTTTTPCFTTPNPLCNHCKSQHKPIIHPLSNHGKLITPHYWPLFTILEYSCYYNIYMNHDSSLFSTHHY